jgi:acetamidase/formamidase
MASAGGRPDCELGDFRLSPSGDQPGIRHRIDNSDPPAAAVESGSVVVFRCPGLPLPPNATAADFLEYDTDRPHSIVGPVHVRGAEPGDTLVAEIIAVRLAQDYGHATVVPGFGLLGDEVRETYVHNFSWEEGASSVEVCPGVAVPLDPFCGILGVDAGRAGRALDGAAAHGRGQPRHPPPGPGVDSVLAGGGSRRRLLRRRRPRRPG